MPAGLSLSVSFLLAYSAKVLSAAVVGLSIFFEDAISCAVHGSYMALASPAGPPDLQRGTLLTNVKKRGRLGIDQIVAIGPKTASGEQG